MSSSLLDPLGYLGLAGCYGAANRPQSDRDLQNANTLERQLGQMQGMQAAMIIHVPEKKPVKYRNSRYYEGRGEPKRFGR